MLPSSATFDHDRDRGFALVIVMWLCGLLALLALSFASSARVHVRIAENAVAAAQAETLADGGVRLGLIKLVAEAERAGRGRPMALACALPGGARLALSISDEAGRVNLNLANEALLAALLRGAGVTEDTAMRLADAIADYRDSDDLRRLNGAEAPEYEAAGLGTTPKNAPFAHLEELKAVLGINRQLFDAVKPHITLHSGLDGVDLREAPAGLEALLAGGASVPLPRGFAATSTGNAFLVRASVITDSGAHAVREAVATTIPVRVPVASTGADPGFGLRARARRPGTEPQRLQAKIWEWRAGAITAAEKLGLTESMASMLPPC